jgi:hypothetical protein
MATQPPIIIREKSPSLEPICTNPSLPLYQALLDYHDVERYFDDMCAAHPNNGVKFTEWGYSDLNYLKDKDCTTGRVELETDENDPQTLFLRTYNESAFAKSHSIYPIALFKAIYLKFEIIPNFNKNLARFEFYPGKANYIINHVPYNNQKVIIIALIYNYQPIGYYDISNPPNNVN